MVTVSCFQTSLLFPLPKFFNLTHNTFPLSVDSEWKFAEGTKTKEIEPGAVLEVREPVDLVSFPAFIGDKTSKIGRLGCLNSIWNLDRSFDILSFDRVYTRYGNDQDDSKCLWDEE